MSIENGGRESSPTRISPIEERQRRIYSYMEQFNKLPVDSVRSEMSRMIGMSGLPNAERKLNTEINKTIFSPLKYVEETTVNGFTTKLAEQPIAEDAMVALLYDLQSSTRGRNLHIVPSELPKLLQILEDTRRRKSSGAFPSNSVMHDSKDQAVLFITQVFFYDEDRVDGRRVIYTNEGTQDDVEIQRLAQKVNNYLPEQDQFIFKKRKLIPKKTEKIKLPETQPEKVEKPKKKISPIQTQAEKKRAEGVEDALWWTSKHLTITADSSGGGIMDTHTPYPPYKQVEIAINQAVGEVFGAQGRENVAFFSLLSRIPGQSEKQVIEWLFTEKSGTKRKAMIERVVNAGNRFFSEVLSPTTNMELVDIFAQDVLNEDLNMKKAHSLLVTKSKRLMGDNKETQLVRELTVDAAERLFLLQRATILGEEIREEILQRRKSMRITPIDAEGTTKEREMQSLLRKIKAMNDPQMGDSTGPHVVDAEAGNDRERLLRDQEIQSLVKKIEEAVEVDYPLNPHTPIKPYEFNVTFNTSMEVTAAMAALIQGDNINNLALFQMNKKDMQRAIYSLGIEKWTHQARAVRGIRQLLPVEDREKAGHILPYSMEETPNRDGSIDRVQTYYPYHYEINKSDPKKRDLFVISDTELSIPVVFEPDKKGERNIRMEYVDELHGTINGLEVKRE